MMTAAQDKLAVDDVVGSFLPREAADAGVGATLRRRSCADWRAATVALVAVQERLL